MTSEKISEQISFFASTVEKEFHVEGCPSYTLDIKMTEVFDYKTNEVYFINKGIDGDRLHYTIVAKRESIYDIVEYSQLINV